MEELEDRCVVCDIVELIEGSELPDEATRCEPVLEDSVRGLSASGDWKSLLARMGFPPACLMAMKRVSVWLLKCYEHFR